MTFVLVSAFWAKYLFEMKKKKKRNNIILDFCTFQNKNAWNWRRKKQNSCPILRITTVARLKSLLYCRRDMIVWESVCYLQYYKIIYGGGLLYKRESWLCYRLEWVINYCIVIIEYWEFWVVKACIDRETTINFMLDRFRSYKT